MKINYPLLILLVSTSLFQSCNAPQQEDVVPDAEASIPVKLIPVEGIDHYPAISVSGQFTTDNEVVLSFKTGGIVKDIPVNAGDRIKKGQLLATLNMTEINAQVQQAQLALEKAERDFKRAQNLYQDSVATLEQLENSETALELARQRIKEANFNQSYSEIRAPANGYVLRRMLNPGQLVAPGTPVLQTNNAGSSNWLLRVAVSDREWLQISAEDSALVEVSGTIIPARVLRKSQGSDPASGAITVDLELQEQPDLNLASGMFGKARIFPGGNISKENSSTWAVPYSAILDGDGSSGYVFITNDRKTALKQPITIAGIEKDKVLISSGLENAREIIVSGSPYLSDSSTIHIVK